MVRITPTLAVNTSIEMIAENGADSFSMRSLASRLEVTPMALYHHFADRDAVLLAVLDQVSAGLERGPATESPRADALAAALALHEFLIGHPWTIRLISTGRLSGVSGLWFPETVLGAGRRAGLDDDAAFVFYRTMFALVVGQATFSLSRQASSADPVKLRQTDPGALPVLDSLSPKWSQLDALATTERVFAQTIDGLLPAPLPAASASAR